MIGAEPTETVVFFGQTSQDGQQLAEHHLTDHHLLEEPLPVLGVVEMSELVAGDLVRETQVRSYLGRISWMSVVRTDVFEDQGEIGSVGAVGPDVRPPGGRDHLVGEASCLVVAWPGGRRGRAHGVRGCGERLVDGESCLPQHTYQSLESLNWYLARVAQQPQQMEAANVAGVVVHEPLGQARVGGADTVVFLIGMRVNRWRRVRSWWPVFVAMPQMLKELQSLDAGLLGARTFWSGRMFVVLQYWRSPEELGAYARNSQLRHAPAWKAFNQRAASTGDVGLFHETYVVKADAIETLYGNLPPVGLAAAHGWIDRADQQQRTSAHERLRTTEPDYAAI